MINKIYNTIKQIGKRVMPYAIAGAMAFGSYSAQAANLPVNQETRQSLTQVSKDYNDLEQKVSNNFNQFIKDGKFDLKEQSKVYKDLNNLGKYAEEHAMTLSQGLEDLYFNLNYNLYRADVGKVELQKNMEKEGIKCYVEPTMKPHVVGLMGLVILGCLLSAIQKEIF